jgi:hypothetical protein
LIPFLFSSRVAKIDTKKPQKYEEIILCCP